nr:hypothetical protein [Tanacetum cinerariifolium]
MNFYFPCLMLGGFLFVPSESITRPTELIPRFNSILRASASLGNDL